MYCKQILFLVCMLSCILLVVAGPDGGETYPVPGPGLAYGGIPYGSKSGDVAEYFRTSPPRARSVNYNIDYAPIEQWLR